MTGQRKGLPDGMDAARKPWWKRKRWIAVAVPWLVVAYPASVGPLLYIDARGWVSRSLYPVIRAAYRPFLTALGPKPAINPFCEWWLDLARRHNAAASL